MVWYQVYIVYSAKSSWLLAGCSLIASFPMKFPIGINKDAIQRAQHSEKKERRKRRAYEAGGRLIPIRCMASAGLIMG